MGKKKSSKGRLTSADIEEFKRLLLEKRAEILGDVSCMENEALRANRSDLSNAPIHMADAGTDNFDQENTLGLMDSERKILRKIDEAFSRIEEGTYGVCEIDDKSIPKARLKAMPWARYCVKCADMVEKGRYGEQESLSLEEELNVDDAA